MIKVNMMCGKRNFGEDWVHIDEANFPHIWSKNTSLGGLPLRSVDLIYCSHGIAYFSLDEFKLKLKHWLWSLIPGGTLRLATPDFNVLSKLYQLGVEFDKLKGPLYGEMEMNGAKIYHKYCYDEAGLTELLTAAGFINIHRYDHSKTDHPNTGNREDFYDDHSAAYINGTLISLNMECEKPNQQTTESLSNGHR